jgi:hypothetical protein
MKKTIGLLAIMVPLVLTGCSLEQKNPSADIYQSPAGSLFDQQSAAYPMLGDNAYLTLKDFEAVDQLDDFSLAQVSKTPGGNSRIVYSGSPTATGGGALGLDFDKIDDYTLTFNLPIRRWTGFNLLICSLYVSNPRVECAIEFLDDAGKSSQTRYTLENGWNKLKIDLSAMNDRVDLACVNQIRFHFFQIGDSEVYLDDLILIDHHQRLAGDPDGPAGSLFAVQDGKRIRIGAVKRFELVFTNGNLIAWYDLATDENRMNNLLPADSTGLELFRPVGGQNAFEPCLPKNEQVTVHTSVSAREGREIQLRTETFFDQFSLKRGPDQVVVYRVRPDGSILLEITANIAEGKLGVGFALAGDQGFDAVVGKVRNPSAKDDACVDYALFRRMGKKAGADLLLAFKPWKAATLPVHCEIDQTAKAGILRAFFTSESREGKNEIRGMIRLWPAKIDHLGNAEKYVREFLESPSSQIR